MMKHYIPPPRSQGQRCDVFGNHISEEFPLPLLANIPKQNNEIGKENKTKDIYTYILYIYTNVIHRNDLTQFLSITIAMNSDSEQSMHERYVCI